MRLEKRPANPLPKNYVPPQGTPYKVKTGDSWVTVADSLQMDVWDLIAFNFQTRDPQEVNWYLRENVGCCWPTRDHKNWMFSTDADPGVIYLPQQVIRLPPIQITPDPADPGKVSGIWFGIGGKEGGQFFLVGKETAVIKMWSWDSMDDSFWMSFDGWRLGPGLGGSIGTVVVIITCLVHPRDLQGEIIGGADFNASLGEKWDSFLKPLKEAKELTRLGKAAKGLLTVAQWEKMRDLVKDAISAAGIKTAGYAPQVVVLDVPGAGWGLEISAFYGLAEVDVTEMSLKSSYRRNR